MAIRITTQSNYSLLYEGVIEAIKKALAPLASGEERVVEEIISGEDELGEKSSIVMVVGGPDRITHSGMRNLEHSVEIYICYLSRETQDVNTLKRLRNIAGLGYDLIMDDITLDGVVLKCVPRLVHPGFLRYGEMIYVGVLQTWQAIKREGFVVPV